jgi:hypothetical protein
MAMNIKYSTRDPASDILIIYMYMDDSIGPSRPWDEKSNLSIPLAQCPGRATPTRQPERATTAQRRPTR